MNFTFALHRQSRLLLPHIRRRLTIGQREWQREKYPRQKQTINGTLHAQQSQKLQCGKKEEGKNVWVLWFIVDRIITQCECWRTSPVTRIPFRGHRCARRIHCRLANNYYRLQPNSCVLAWEKKKETLNRTNRTISMKTIFFVLLRVAFAKWRQMRARVLHWQLIWFMEFRVGVHCWYFEFIDAYLFALFLCAKSNGKQFLFFLISPLAKKKKRKSKGDGNFVFRRQRKSIPIRWRFPP